jgi:hypothetical protein
MSVSAPLSTDIFQRIPENQFALGPDAEGLPVQWRLADNDNRRLISNVA